ncbi:MAG: hypothetical protein GY861_10460 [bacterium]|nr:hypothetical protein [bacterium]
MPTDTQIALDSSKPLVCNSNKFMDVSASPLSCGTDCASNYSSSPGNETTKGFCNFSCATSWASSKVTCKNTNSDITNLKANFACETDHIKSFYRCTPKAQDNLTAIHFSMYYNSPSISIGNSILGDLTQYYLDIWFMQDTRYMDWTMTGDLHILKTNCIALYRANNLAGSNDFNFKANSSTSSAFDLDSKYYWNKITFHVTLSSGTYTVKIYKTHFSANVSTTTSSSCNLSNICFCQNDSSCACGTSLKWVSGYYKNLKIFDATNLPIDSYKDYDT